ncbi:PfkB family carbohydrate kinase [Streptomyces tauricus]|uniref:PfkB family carbohydrate kinase n=1 Tax=Streptomyces tauricus TaxID=68274 RepID=A0ABZ1JQ90_9ACTN|nr:PfkB family carbohydrate kinase [Streptomyces tauricus]
MPHTFDFDLLVIGDANPDVVLGPLDAPLAFGQHEQLVDSGLLTLGGSAAVTAATAPESVEAAAAALAAYGPHVIVKNGADGALAHDGSTLLRTDGIPARPVDTVGAGDSFDAGFVAARLRGLSTADALALAAACGALSTRAHGGTPSQPTWDEAVAALSRNGKNL